MRTCVLIKKKHYLKAFYFYRTNGTVIILLAIWKFFLTIFVALQSIMQTTIFFLFYSTEIVNILVKFLTLIKG